MPIYDFVCARCSACRDVLVDYRTKKGLELLCVDCGGVMRAAEVSRFTVVSSSAAADNAQAHSRVAKSCGHTNACRCAVKTTRPNPFQAQVDAANGNAKPQ